METLEIYIIIPLSMSKQIWSLYGVMKA